MTTKVDRVSHVYNEKLSQPDPFLDNPAEFLVKTVALKLKEYDVWTRIFGEYIDPYKRMDYGINSLPALRIYNNETVKTYDSWFVEGDLIMDIIWPASIRRPELQQLPDTVSHALLQQFRRPSFFSAVETEPDPSPGTREGYKIAGVPGLNELGKRFRVDKSLGFQLSNDEVVPLTQMTVNFRVDLRQWDEYLVENLRTKDDPFEQTLGDLETIVTTIEGLRDDESVSVTLESEADVSGGS